MKSRNQSPPGKQALGVYVERRWGRGGIACKKTQRREAMECGLALSTRAVITLHWGKVTQITWGNILRLVSGKPHLILKLKGETLIATSTEAGMATEAICGVTTSLNLSNTWAFLKWVFALSVHFTEFPSRRISRIPPVLCLPSLRFSQWWPLWQIHSLFSATYPGARPSAAKLQILDSNPVHCPSRDLGSRAMGGPLTKVSMHRQSGWAAGGMGNFRIHGSSRSSASYSAMTWRRYCFLGTQPADRALPRSGVSALMLRGAEVRNHGARGHSRGFDRSAQAPCLHLLWVLSVHKERSWGWKTQVHRLPWAFLTPYSA